MGGLALYLGLPEGNRITDLGELSGAVFGVGVVFASIMTYLAQASRRTKRLGVSRFLCPIAVLFIGFFLYISSFMVNGIVYWSVSYLLAGGIVFLFEIFVVTMDDMFEAMISSPITRKGKQNTESNRLSVALTRAFVARWSDDSRQRSHVHLVVCRGDAILATCDDIEAGRELARRILGHGRTKPVVYVSADHPWTVVRDRFLNHGSNCYCIDCFTNFFGFDEFIQGEDSAGLTTCTLSPVTIKELHTVLREVRRNVIETTLRDLQTGRLLLNLQHADCQTCLNGFKRAIEVQAYKCQTCREPWIERSRNVLVIYDSVSSFASIFDPEDFLKFLVHDISRDKTVGRNTLLLLQRGGLDRTIVKRLETACDMSLDIGLCGSALQIDVKKMRDATQVRSFVLH